MEILQKLNSPVMYLICGTIVLFAAVICVLFGIRAYRAGLRIGMDPVKLKRTITASVTFAVLPSIGILLGVIGILGEYLARVYTEIKGRPVYIISETNTK